MNTSPFGDARIVQSWRINAGAWARAVRDGRIESRTQVTDAAIVDAVLSRSPRSVLDVGCGEGWLARELSARNIDVVGVDVIPELVEEAQCAGGGDFRVISYEDLSADHFGAAFDAVVCNFSLLGKASVESVFESVPSLLTPDGGFIVQTLHPAVACGDYPYRDGWREGSWAGFDDDFSDPAPWYFRTLETWMKLFVEHGVRLLEIREPVHPTTERPVSVIFVGAR